MKKMLRKWLGINELEEKVNETSQIVFNNATAIKNDIEGLWHGLHSDHTKIQLFDGRIKEMELSMDLMSSGECADYLGVSDSTIKRKLQDGELLGKKIGNTWIVTKLELLRYENRIKAEENENNLS